MSVTGHLPTTLETAKALCEVEPARLAVGHGKVLEDPLPKMDEAIREAEAKVRGKMRTVTGVKSRGLFMRPLVSARTWKRKRLEG